MARQKRNDLCACGSGKKFKSCHGGKKNHGQAGDVPESRADKLTFGFVAVVVVALVIWGLVTMFTPAPASTLDAAAGPSGTAPAGKVWSEEHGHYH